MASKLGWMYLRVRLRLEPRCHHCGYKKIMWDKKHISRKGTRIETVWHCNVCLNDPVGV